VWKICPWEGVDLLTKNQISLMEAGTKVSAPGYTCWENLNSGGGGGIFISERESGRERQGGKSSAVGKGGTKGSKGGLQPQKKREAACILSSIGEALNLAGER